MAEPDLARMLLESAHSLESVNLLELLPLDVINWYERQKLEEEIERLKDQTAGMRFLDSKAE